MLIGGYILRLRRFLRDVPDADVILFSPVIPFLLLVAEWITFPAAALLTVIPVVFHHYGRDDE